MAIVKKLKDELKIEERKLEEINSEVDMKMNKRKTFQDKAVKI